MGGSCSIPVGLTQRNTRKHNPTWLESCTPWYVWWHFQQTCHRSVPCLGHDMVLESSENCLCADCSMNVGLCMERHLPDLPGNAWMGEATRLALLFARSSSQQGWLSCSAVVRSKRFARAITGAALQQHPMAARCQAKSQSQCSSDFMVLRIAFIYKHMECCGFYLSPQGRTARRAPVEVAQGAQLGCRGFASYGQGVYKHQNCNELF